MCFDSWTNHRQKYANVLAVVDGLAVYLESTEIEHNSEPQLITVLEGAEDTVKKCGGVLVAVCGDNYSGCVSAMEVFCGVRRGVVPFRCQAHSLQLAIGDCMALPQLQRPLKLVQKYVDFFDNPDRSPSQLFN